MRPDATELHGCQYQDGGGVMVATEGREGGEAEPDWRTSRLVIHPSSLRTRKAFKERGNCHISKQCHR